MGFELWKNMGRKNMTPKEILEQTRQLIKEYAAGDPDKWWYTNRYVFARLQLDERKTKTNIKRDLLNAGLPCHLCGKPFETKRDVHLHRLDKSKGYIKENCVLMHPDCHRKWHAEHKEEQATAPAGQPLASRTWRSRRYDDKPFLYWWDITPAQVARFDEIEDVEFVKKDTGERCIIPAATLKRFLTPDRQTSRSQGNWGIKILKDRPDELAFEPPTGSDDWLFLPVLWINEEDED